MIDFRKINGATETIELVAPDVMELPLLWTPVLEGMATYREVFVDDIYDLVDLDRMISAIEYKNALSSYQNYVQEQESKAARKTK